MRGFTDSELFTHSLPQMSDGEWRKLYQANDARVMNRPRLEMAENMSQPWAAYKLVLNNGRRNKGGCA